MSIIIRIRRGSSSQWASSTKVLQIGELGIDTTLNKIKAGNGSSLWSALPWLTITPDELTTQASSTLSDANSYTDTAVSSLGNSISGQYVEVGDVGVADGVASLGPDGKIPDSEIPDGIARDSELKRTAVQWTANHYQLEGGANTRYLAGDVVYDGGNLYVANFDNESLPTTNTQYWTNIGTGNRLNIDGRDIPNILWDNILQKPTLFSGSYDDLTNKPTLFSGSYSDLTNKPTLFSGSYDDLTNKPTIPSLTGYATETYVNTAVSNLVDSAPETLNTLNELAAALGDDANYATTISTALGLKAPIESPTFTGTVGGITKSMVGLGNADNTSDANKPISTATQTALDAKLAITEPAIDYYITNSGSGAYLVNGVSNGTVYFEKGKKYRVHVNATGHPFWIQTVSGAYSSSNVYNTGITNNGTQNGHIIVELPQTAPQLYYACQFHSSMAGSVTTFVNENDNVYISDSGTARTINSSTDKYSVVEFNSSSPITVTIPNDTQDAGWSIGSYVEIRQIGSGQITVTKDAAVTYNAPESQYKTRVQWSSLFLEKRAANTWLVTGDATA